MAVHLPYFYSAKYERSMGGRDERDAKLSASGARLIIPGRLMVGQRPLEP